MSTSTVLLVALGLAAFAAVLIHNRLVALRARVANAYAQIDVQLQRRHELVPNLVETAKGYLRHERETLLAVTEARDGAERCRATAGEDVGARARGRAPAPDGAALGALAGAETALSGALGRLRIVMEAYPEIRADENLRELADDLESTENRVAYARQAYGDAVMAYNTAQEQFPASLVARAVGVRPAAQFELPSSAMRAPVDVSFA